MPDDRESPSAGWEEVYDEMEAETGIEEATHPCPDCGRTCENLLRDVYECEEHGVFRASASGGDESSGSDGTSESSSAEDRTASADDSDEVENRVHGRAD